MVELASRGEGEPWKDRSSSTTGVDSVREGVDDPDALAREHLPWLLGWLRGRTDDLELAHDVCQETFLKALRARSQWAGLRSVSSWLYRIASNTLRDHLRRRRRTQKRFQELEDLEGLPAVMAAESTLESHEEANILLQEIRSLPEIYREPLLLRHAQSLSGAQVATILGISENAAQVRIHRARRLLLERLAKRERGKRKGE